MGPALHRSGDFSEGAGPVGTAEISRNISGTAVIPGFRFPKHHRLLKRSAFLGLSKKGKKIQNRHFIALYSRRDDIGSRLGVTVSKRVGNSVIRNRIKRHCREYFRHHARRFKSPVDINIIAKREAAALTGNEVAASLEKLFSNHRGDIF
ncbi:MAG: ribonuclease P protein component [Pseudomonadota bacterium]